MHFGSEDDSRLLGMESTVAGSVKENGSRIPQAKNYHVCWYLR